MTKRIQYKFDSKTACIPHETREYFEYVVYSSQQKTLNKRIS